MKQKVNVSRNSRTPFMQDTVQYIAETPNLSYVGDLIGTKDYEFQKKFVDLLKIEFTSDLGKYLYHIKIDEPRAAAEVVHKLKYKFSVLGMKKAFVFAENHKERLHDGNTDLDADFRKTLKTVSSFLETV